MLTVDCKLYHSKREQEELVATVDKRTRSSEVGKRTSPESCIYKPLGAYNLFSSTKPRASSIVLLREPVHGKTIEEYFSREKDAKHFQQTLDSFARFYTVDHVYQPCADDAEVFDRSVKPLVKSLITGKSSTIIVSGPLKSRNNKMLYRLNPEGLLMQIYSSASELVGMLKRGGKYAKKDFVLKARGFNIVGDLRTDIFALNPLDPSAAKQKSLRLDLRQDMVEFCKICRNSISVVRAALQRPEVEKEILQCIQLSFEVKDGETVFQQATLSIIKATITEETTKLRSLSSFQMCLHNAILAKSTKCEVIYEGTGKEPGEPVGRPFTKIFMESHKFYLLMLLQTADSFENNRATLGYFKGILETKLINKRNKKLGGKIEEEDAESQEDEFGANRLTNSQLRSKTLGSEHEINETSTRGRSKHDNYTETTRPNMGACVSERSKRYIKEENEGGESAHHFMSDPRFGGSKTKVTKVPPMIDIDNSAGTHRIGIEMMPTSPTIGPGELDKLNAKISSICKSYGLVTAEKEKSEHEYQEAKEIIRQLEDQSTRLETEVEMLKSENKRAVEAKVAEIDRIRADHMKTLEEKEGKLTAKTFEAERLTRERDRFRDEGLQKEEINTQLKAELGGVRQLVKTTEEKLHMKDLECKGLESKVQKLEAEVEDVISNKEKLDRAYKRQIQTLQEEAEDKLQKAQGKARLLETQIHGLEVKGRSQTDEYEALKREMSNINNLYKSALDKQTSLHCENNKAQTEIMTLRTELEKVKEMLSHREGENRELKQENTQMNSLRKEFEEHKKNAASRTAEVQKQLNTAYEEAKELRLKQKDLKKELEQKESECQEMTQTIELTYVRMERDVSINKAEMEKIAAALRASNEALLKERTANSKLRTDLETAETANRKLVEKNSSLNSEVTGLKSRLQDVEIYVERKVSSSNTNLRMYSQQVTTVKKTPPVKDETITGILEIVADYKNSLMAQK